jgi:hypothetical protein
MFEIFHRNRPQRFIGCHGSAHFEFSIFCDVPQEPVQRFLRCDGARAVASMPLLLPVLSTPPMRGLLRLLLLLRAMHRRLCAAMLFVNNQPGSLHIEVRHFRTRRPCILMQPCLVSRGRGVHLIVIVLFDD